MIDVAIPGPPHSVRVNRYIVNKGEAKNLVLYWYQSHNRVVASEYLAKIYLVLDSIRYHRSDTSIVRVLVPLPNGGEDAAQAAAVSFIQSSFDAIDAPLPR
jgi:EpsI family protein